MTLEPPGTIAIVGAGVFGIEAALYGRFLGYNIQLVEQYERASRWDPQRGNPLPILPDRCLSPLAISALEAQRGDSTPMTLPVTIDQWIDDALVPLTETDLLRGRVMTQSRVIRIDTVEVDSGETEDADSEPYPPDFRLAIATDDATDDNGTEMLDAEAVLIATGPANEIELGFDLPAEYFFELETDPQSDLETSLRQGLRQIVAVFATLGGRQDLDLYRPRRG